MSDNDQDCKAPQEEGGKEKEDQPIVSKKLTREEREDFIHSLEHIVIAGSSNRHTAKRVQEWEEKVKHETKEDDSDESDPTSDDSDKDEEDENTTGAATAAEPLHMMHSEDVRIYGKHGYPQQNWPRRGPNLHRDDVEWDKEHGDGIHPLAFLEARLSSFPPPKRQRVDGPNLSIDKTDPTVAFEDVPRAMLLRCWERAVHAASTLIDCDKVLNEEEEDDPDDESTLKPCVTKYSVDNAIKKCKELNIALKAGGEQQACPSCGILFESNELLQKHFYGRPNQQRGCCWTKVRITQCELLDRMLQQEVKECATGLMQIVMTSLDEQKSPPTQNWQDVLRILETACADSRVQNDAPDPTTETMQYEPGRGRFTLNPLVLRNSKKRAIDRYADLPK